MFVPLLEKIGRHEDLTEAEAAAAIERAIEAVLADGGPRTPDIGGRATTKELGAAIASAVSS